MTHFEKEMNAMISRESEKLLKWLYKHKDKPYTKKKIEKLRNYRLPLSCYKNLETQGYIETSIKPRKDNKDMYEPNVSEILQYTITDKGISYVEFPNWLFRKCREVYSAFALVLSIVAILVSVISCSSKEASTNQTDKPQNHHSQREELPPKFFLRW